jgi:MFS family permease
MLSLAKPLQYYQIFLSQGVGMGIGVGFTFTPTLSNISHQFYERKALAVGIILSGSSVGAMIFPISKQFLSVYENNALLIAILSAQVKAFHRYIMLYADDMGCRIVT